MKTRIRLFAVVMAAGLAASAGDALAQQGSAELRGRVTDDQGAALPGVAIVVKHQESGIFRQASTTADGSYFLAGVLPGTYELTAELTGFKHVSRARRPARGRQDRDDRREPGGRRA